MYQISLLAIGFNVYERIFKPRLKKSVEPQRDESQSTEKV